MGKEIDLNNLPTLIAVISGKKVAEDDRTRWFVFCYLCRDGVSEAVLDADSLREQQEAHDAWHRAGEPTLEPAPEPAPQPDESQSNEPTNKEQLD